jgi:assimilatory nitrate reductase catalytic subunit
MLHVLLWDGCRPRFIRAHTRVRGAARRVRDVTPAIAAAGLRRAGGGHRPRRALVRAKLTAAMSLWCQGLNQSHHGTHNGAALIALHAGDRQDRPARLRARSRSPASPTRWAGARSAASRTCCRRIAISRTRHIAPKSRGCGASTACPRARPHRRRTVRRAARDGRVKAVWIACTNPAQSMPEQELRPRGARALRVRRAAGSLRRHRDGAVRRPAAARRDLGREGRHGHQFRAPHHARAPRRAGAGRGPRRLAHRPRLRAARSVRARQATSAARLFAYESPEDVFREHVATTAAATSTSAASTTRLLEGDGSAAVAVPGGAQPRRRGSTRTALRDAGRARALRRPGARRSRPRTPMRAYPLKLTTGRLRDQWHGMSRTARWRACTATTWSR